MYLQFRYFSEHAEAQLRTHIITIVVISNTHYNYCNSDI